ncbi:MAG: CBS domain-containing protein [Myxococcales bacterium]|nr:CBS domain-containing protein [Myxococcales bacterium]
MRMRIPVQRTEGSRGTEGMYVYCSRQRGRMGLDDCAACEFCHGITIDPTGRSSFLMCDVRHLPISARELPISSRPAREQSLATRTAISAIMQPVPVRIHPDSTVESVLEEVINRNLYGVPVVDDDGKPVGIISKSDFLRERYFERDSAEWRQVAVADDAVTLDLGPGFHIDEATHLVVSELMTPLVFCLPDEASVAQAAALMTIEGVHQVPVLDLDGRVCGIVSALDILRFYAQIDGLLSH